MKITTGFSQETKGVLITTVGVLVLSLEAMLIRLISADPWTVLVARGLLAAIGLFVIFQIFEGRTAGAQLRAMGLAGLLAAVLFAIDNIAFIYSITHTSVANTLLMISLAPLFAALQARLFLQERLGRATWLAITGATFGTLIILSGSLTGGDLLGTLAGLIAAMSLGGTLVVLRSRPSLNLIPSMACGAGLAALVMLPAANPESAQGNDWVLLIILGLFVMPIAFGAISQGPRYIPAPEVALLLLLEAVLGAVWVWIAVDEVPSAATVIGGAILVSVLTVYFTNTLRTSTNPSPNSNIGGAVSKDRQPPTGVNQ